MGANFGIILNASIVILACSPNAINPPHDILFHFPHILGLKLSKITWLNIFYCLFCQFSFLAKFCKYKSCPIILYTTKGHFKLSIQGLGSNEIEQSY